jgi:hypothetical protein
LFIGAVLLELYFSGFFHGVNVLDFFEGDIIVFADKGVESVFYFILWSAWKVLAYL